MSGIEYSKDLADQFNKRRIKNLQFFKTYFPQIYHVFQGFHPVHSKLEIFESGDVNLIIDEKREYDRRYEQIINSEVAEFETIFSPNTRYESVVKPLNDSYECPRFSQRILKSTIQASVHEKEGSNGFYYLPEEYPLLVFLGCGLGKHVQSLLSDRKAQHVVLFEKSIDALYLSLYITDWFTLCEPFVGDNGRTFQFLVSGSENFEINWKMLWNELVRYCPFFPVATLYFNHQGKDSYDKISEKINSEIPSLMLSWGHFDDELNQLNNAIHNHRSSMSRYSGKILAKYFDYPVLILGSGPSLDDYIDWLLTHREKVIVVSCGSSLSALLRNNIKPDFHFALESDYVEYELLGGTDEKALLSETILFGAMQVNPYVFQNDFESKLTFFKDDGLVGNLSNNFVYRVRNAGPTCTNTAFSVIANLGFENIYFIGMDFGFKDLDYHHAKSTVYYDETQSDSLREIAAVDRQQLMQLTTVNGEPIWCRPYYYLSKERLEQEIEYYENEIHIYNLSDGANIIGSLHIEKAEFLRKTAYWTQLNRKEMRKCIIDHSNEFTRRVDSGFDEKLSELKIHVHDYTNKLVKVISKIGTSETDLLASFAVVRNMIEDRSVSQTKEAMHLLNGTLKHFLYVGLSHALSSNDDKTNRNFIESWKQKIIEFLNGVDTQLDMVLTKGSNLDSDTWLKRSINEAVD